MIQVEALLRVYNIYKVTIRHETTSLTNLIVDLICKILKNSWTLLTSNIGSYITHTNENSSMILLIYNWNIINSINPSVREVLPDNTWFADEPTYSNVFANPKELRNLK
jgi:hypothetical protein